MLFLAVVLLSLSVLSSFDFVLGEDDRAYKRTSSSPFDQYIVTFTSYRPVKDHENKIQIWLKFHPSTSWKFIARRNKASIDLPTDFVIIETFNDSLIQILRQYQEVRTISRQTEHSRSLHSFNKATPNESFPRFQKRPTGRTIVGEEAKISNRKRTYETQQEKLKIHGFGSGYLWKKGFTGKDVKVGVFDTGLLQDRRYFPNVVDETDWTGEGTTIDNVGHGTFVAGLIGGRHPSCPGIAPDVDLYIFRVFTGSQVSYTSWFLDAFNYALHKGIDVINLSIGGPDFADDPFTDKVNEITAHGMIIVSAIGNDGPLWGTLNNPGDMMDVIGVGGAEPNGMISPFSSRGMTSHELELPPYSYGRVKPDLVAYARLLSGPSHKSVSHCGKLSGTSVASPVVAGVVALLESTIPFHRRRFVVNPASMKRALMKGARPLRGSSMYEQGAGLLDIKGAFEELMAVESEIEQSDVRIQSSESRQSYKLKDHNVNHGDVTHKSDDARLSDVYLHLSASRTTQHVPRYITPGPQAIVFPPTFDLRVETCPLTWPHCGQPLIRGGLPVSLNATVFNVAGVEGRLETPTWIPGVNGKLLTVKVTLPSRFWPWACGLGIHLSTNVDPHYVISAEGVLRFHVLSVHEGLLSVVDLPIKVSIAPTPPREKRILWDVFHSIRYPSGYIPRDNLAKKTDMLDWLGDHPHTNFHVLFREFVRQGFHVDIISEPISCQSQSQLKQYGALLVIDTEDQFTHEESSIIATLVKETGMTLVVAADWYDEDIIRGVRFEDDNTQSMWSAVMAGSNVPALNEVLREHGIAFGDSVFSGNIRVGLASFRFGSGVSLVQFPRGGELIFSKIMQLEDKQSSSPGQNHSPNLVPHVPVLGLTKSGKGTVLAYGDSNCIDTHYEGAKCYGFFVDTVRKAIGCSGKELCRQVLEGSVIMDDGLVPDTFGVSRIAKPLSDDILALLEPHSRTMKHITKQEANANNTDKRLCRSLHRRMTQKIPTSARLGKFRPTEMKWAEVIGSAAKYYEPLHDIGNLNNMIVPFANLANGLGTMYTLSVHYRIRSLLLLILGTFLVHKSIFLRRSTRIIGVRGSRKYQPIRLRGGREPRGSLGLLPSIVHVRSESPSL